MLELLTKYFTDQSWHIEIEDGNITAVMDSGYGSGPAVINLTELAAHILKEYVSYERRDT